MKQVRDPDTGQVLEEYDDYDQFFEAIQEALNRRIIEFTGQYRDGKPLYRHTSVGRHGLITGKHGTAVDTNARDAAVAASLLLQHGCSVDTLRRALTRNGDGSASGPLARVLDLLAEGI